MPSQNSFGAAGELRSGGQTYKIFRLSAIEKAGFDLNRIPYSIKIVLENLLRFEDGLTVKKSDVEYVAQWDTKTVPREVNFRPARVSLQDFTAVPSVLHLAPLPYPLQRTRTLPKHA